MSRKSRIELRETYMQGWYRMDIDRLLGSTAPDFIFDDPAEEAPVARDGLEAYMHRWDARLRALGGNNEWQLTHQLRKDENGVPRDGITVLVATGLHRPNLGEELAELIGDTWVQETPQLRQNIAQANELPSIALSDTDVADLLAFLESLTDFREADLNALVPAAVPSGLPVED